MGKVCVDTAGRIERVTIVQGIPGADAKVLETLRTWRFRPQPVPICTLIRFEYETVPHAPPSVTEESKSP